MKTLRVNWNEPYDFLLTRPSIFNNPYSHKENTLALYKVNSKREAVDKFKEYFDNNPELQEKCKILKESRLACVCPTGTYCYVDIIVDFLEKDNRLEQLFN